MCLIANTGTSSKGTLAMKKDHVTPGSKENQEQYNWSFNGRIMVIDNGGRFSSQENFKAQMELNTFSVVCFDPLNKLASIKDLDSVEELQIVPNITLGNGQPVTRFDCLNETTSATLKPLDRTIANTKATQEKDSGPNSILVQHPINSIALDDIDGLSRSDWILLDELNDNVAILQSSPKRFQNALLIDINIPFLPTHEGQADFPVLCYLLQDYGFEFFRFQQTIAKTDLPTDIYLEKKQFSQTKLVQAVFLPTEARLQIMEKNDLLKLGFLLYTIYKCKDTAYKILNYVDADLARDYLIAEGFLWPVDEAETEFVLTESYSPDIWSDTLSV